MCSILQWIGRLLQSPRSPLRVPFASLLTVGNLAQNAVSLTSGSQPLHIVQDTVVRDTVAPGVFSIFYPSVLKARHWKTSLQAEAAHTLPLVCLFHGKANCTLFSFFLFSLWCLRFEADRAFICVCILTMWANLVLLWTGFCLPCAHSFKPCCFKYMQLQSKHLLLALDNPKIPAVNSSHWEYFI